MKRKYNTSTIMRGIFIITILLSKPDVVHCKSNTEKIIIGEKIVIHSDILNEDRTIHIRFPKDYEESQTKYPVLYVLDGEFFFLQTIGAVNFLSECTYIYNNPISKMIVVGLVNVDRNRDFTPTYAPVQSGNLRFPTSGKADEFTGFLSSELIPYIDSNYMTQPYRILAGWSLGGLFTVHTFFENPDLFSAYLAISPSLWWDKDLYVALTDSILTNHKILEKKLTITAGTLEGGDIGRSVRDGFVPIMKEKLDPGFPFKFVEIPDEGHYFVPYKAIYKGLISIYSDWRMPFERISEGLHAVESFYKTLSEKYGYEIKITEWAYMNLINSLKREQKFDEALEIAQQYFMDYPKLSWTQFFLGSIYEQLNDYETAKNYYQKAIEFEKSNSEPDSERIVTFTINLNDLEKKIEER